MFCFLLLFVDDDDYDDELFFNFIFFMIRLCFRVFLIDMFFFFYCVLIFDFNKNFFLLGLKVEI